MKGILHDCVTKDFMEEVIPNQGLKNMSRNLYQAKMRVEKIRHLKPECYEQMHGGM